MSGVKPPDEMDRSLAQPDAPQSIGVSSGAPGDSLRAPPNLRPVLDEMLAALTALQDSDKALLLMREPVGDALVVAASAGFDAQHLKVLGRVSIAAHPWGTAVASGEAVIVGDVSAERDFITPQFARAAGFRATHLQPVILGGGEVIGVIVTCFREPHAVTKRERRVVEVFARQASWMITSARLLERSSAALAAESGRVASLLADSERMKAQLIDHVTAREADRLELANAERQRDSLQRERDSLLRERDSLQVERDSRERERGDLEKERGRLEAIVSEQKQSETELRFLSEASSLLAASLDYGDTLPSIARLAVPLLADFCVIDITDEKGVIRRVAAAHADPAKASLANESLKLTPDPASINNPVVRALRTGMSDLVSVYPPPSSPRQSPPGVPRVSDEERVPGQFVRGSGEQARATDPLEYFGNLIPASLIVVPLFARGRTRGAITLAITDSDRRYTAADLALAEELARRAGLAVDNARLYQDAYEANRAKSDFLGVMSHELRTPLSAIIGYVDILLLGDQSSLPEEARRQIERVGSASRHLLQLIEEIFTFSRLEAGTEELLVESIEIATLLAETAATVEPLAAEYGLEFQLTPLEESRYIVTDRPKLQQILLNLLSNAVKFTERGTVTLGATLDRDEVVFEVTDTGIGIPPQHHERIFDPFWQVENAASRRIAGTGLGLSVTRRLSRLLGGEVTVDSTVGKGSTFHVRLPLRSEAPSLFGDPATKIEQA